MLSTLSVVALVCAEEGSGTAGRELAGLAVERVAAEMAEATEEVLEDCDPGRTLEDSCCVRLCLSSSRKRRDLRASYDSERGMAVSNCGTSSCRQISALSVQLINCHLPR